MGRRAARVLFGIPALDAARGEVVAARCTATTKTTISRPQDTHRGHRRATSRPRCSDRCASSPGMVEEHLRHGVLPADEYRRLKPVASSEQPADDHRHGRSATRSTTRSKGASSSAGRSCSGCATGWRSSVRRREVEALAASVPDTDGVYFVPALYGAGRARTGISTPGEPSVGLTPRHDGRRISPARRWRASPTRRWTSWAPWQRDSGITLRELKVDGGAGTQQSADAVPVRPARTRASIRPGDDGNHGAGCGLSGRTGRRLLGEHRRNPAAMAGGARIRTHGRPLADREGRRRVGRRRTQGTAQQQRLKYRDYGNHTVYQVPVRIHRDTGARTRWATGSSHRRY